MYAMQDIYDVIILDIMMPIMNGYEVLEKIRNKKIFTPVLILTAKDALNDKIKGFMDDIVKKTEEEGYVETAFGRRRYVPELGKKRRQRCT